MYTYIRTDVATLISLFADGFPMHVFRVFVLKRGECVMYAVGRRGRSPLEIAVCQWFGALYIRACRLRPCKRVTRSINPLGAGAFC